MSTLTGHLSLYATQSLKAIDNWMNVAQGNIGNSLRTASKEVELMYGGGLTHELRPTSSTKNGVQIGEQVLTTGNTRVDWSQGEIIKSTQDTHFAINGEGFFMVVNPKETTTFNGTFTGTTAGVYLTRAGDFHWAQIFDSSGNNIGGSTDELVLVNNEGMIVISDGASSGVPGTTDDISQPVTYSQFYNTTVRDRPSVFQPTTDTAFGGATVTNIVDYDELKYSKFGSHILKAETATKIKTIVNGSGNNLDKRNPNSVDSTSNLVEKALEASNIRVERNITELAAMGKIYNGFVQLIKVYNSNLDEVLGFIR